METKHFETREQAEEWMAREVNDECVDNYRFAFQVNSRPCRTEENSQ